MRNSPEFSLKARLLLDTETCTWFQFKIARETEIIPLGILCILTPVARSLTHGHLTQSFKALDELNLLIFIRM